MNWSLEANLIVNYLGTSEKMPRKGKEHLHDLHRKENLHDMLKFTCHRSLTILHNVDDSDGLDSCLPLNMHLSYWM